MTRTLTTEKLRQIKADIAARKAMPEYGESVEGNIERLRVIGATRSHFSTETVEMLVRALEEKSRSLADAERERDDWVDHSRRMEHRAIEAKELLANREAQPVAVVISRGNLAHVTDCDLELGTKLYTAPPAPAVPDAIPEVDRGEGGSDIDYMQPQEIYDMGKTDGWNACRAAMLAQHVSGGYKLVPAEPTEDMIAAAMNCDDVSFNADETFCVNFGNIYAAMLAAAPEGDK